MDSFSHGCLFIDSSAGCSRPVPGLFAVRFILIPPVLYFSKLASLGLAIRILNGDWRGLGGKPG